MTWFQGYQLLGLFCFRSYCFSFSFFVAFETMAFERSEDAIYIVPWLCFWSHVQVQPSQELGAPHRDESSLADFGMEKPRASGAPEEPH